MMVVGRPNLPAILPRIRLIDSYLARSIAVPLVGCLVLAAMLLILDKMLRLFQYVVDAGGPVSVACRKLALSSELDALRGIGISYGRMLRVPYWYAVPLALINLLIVGYVQPY